MKARAELKELSSHLATRRTALRGLSAQIMALADAKDPSVEAITVDAGRPKVGVGAVL